MIDSDDIRYTVEFLHKWKNLSEEAAILELESLSPSDNSASDIALMKFYLQCFDRPAFQDDIRQEGRMEDFDKALEDTIIALNTGILRARDGYVLKKAEGKSFLHNQDWRDKLDAIVDILTAIRRRLKVAEANHSYLYHEDGYNGFYYFRDRRLAEWINFSREEALRILSSICDETGLRAPRFLNRHYGLFRD